MILYFLHILARYLDEKYRFAETLSWFFLYYIAENSGLIMQELRVQLQKRINLRQISTEGLFTQQHATDKLLILVLHGLTKST